MFLKPLNYYIVMLTMLGFLLIIVFISHFLQFPNANPLLPNDLQTTILQQNPNPDPFIDLMGAFKIWDSKVGCLNFRGKYKLLLNSTKVKVSSLQEFDSKCEMLKMNYVSVLVKKWTWIPDNLDNLYSCRCGLTCLWTKSAVLADKPDVLLFETSTPPSQRRKGQPLRAYMDLEAERRRSGFEDIFVGYHAKDDVQSTYAGSLFHNNRNYYLSRQKNNNIMLGEDVV
ncbi:hypothetical protein AQUCO_01400169v1 [Aquilegia coerulea]|uniref:Uncharacterized protein n=1 Tax=Aquilegia coerulea TaxID=218851 RepID=A0A2G5DVM2_AQUCA|nr:hypothetical protein AQUCO_01400169v1 [Aquilegia coerulea]